MHKELKVRNDKYCVHADRTFDSWRREYLNAMFYTNPFQGVIDLPNTLNRSNSQPSISTGPSPADPAESSFERQSVPRFPEALSGRVAPRGLGLHFAEEEAGVKVVALRPRPTAALQSPAVG